MHKTKRTGFSLAEALITLLIVCLITLASIPILTKKKRTIQKEKHGAFACYYTGDATTLHGYYYIDRAVTTAPTKYVPSENRWGCVFNPPAGAKNFVVTIVGGGGGGAAAKANSYTKHWGRGTHYFSIPTTGVYDGILSGGGGGGGGTGRQGDNIRGGGGAAAGLAAFLGFNMNEGDQLKIVVGAGG